MYIIIYTFFIIMTYQNNKFDWDKFQEEIINNIGKDNLINYIFNEKNRVITENIIKEILNNYGIDYQVYNLKIFQIAMTHPSYIYKDWTQSKNFKMIFMGINLINGDTLLPISESQKHMTVPLGQVSYERLEFVGDSIIRLIISDYLLIREYEMQEGDMTKLRSQIENGSSLAEMSRKIGLNKYGLFSRNFEAVNARNKNEKCQCDLFEAFIAALYYDACKINYNDIGKNYDLMNKERGIGYEICFKLVTSLIEEEIDLTQLLGTESNHKDELLQEFHKKNWGDPKYGVMEVIVNDNKMGKKYYKMYVRDNEGNIIGTGIGSSKQKGEKLAAKKALQFLKIIPDDNENEILNNNSNEIYFKNNIQENNDDDEFIVVTKKQSLKGTKKTSKKTSKKSNKENISNF